MKTLKHLPVLLLAALCALATAHSEVFIDLDIANDAVKNRGTLGDPTVNLRTAGAFVPVGNGQGFKTGANGMGSSATNGPETGTITWKNAAIAGKVDTVETFSMYMWLKPETAPTTVARIFNKGVFGVGFNNGNVFLQINGKQTNCYFYGLAKNAAAKWIFVGISFAKGDVTACFGTPDSPNLTFVNAVSDQAQLKPSAVDLVIGNVDQLTRPFQGVIGTFFLSDDAGFDLNKAFESTREKYAGH
ncbi:MAG: hypothetical protein WC003_02075 [Terrimicrobiaceae bacterium]